MAIWQSLHSGVMGMRVIHGCFLVALGLFLALGMVGAEEYVLPPGSLHVEDGDTLLVKLDGEEKRVQLAGIDAPEETDNPKLQRDLARTGLERSRLLALGRMATEYLRRLTKIGWPYTLHYEPDRLDRYGRLSGDLRDGSGRSLAELVVAGGYAIASRDATERMWALQDEAQQEQRGLWGLEPEATSAWAGITQK